MSAQESESFNLAGISDPIIQDFILAHENDDENKILLKNKIIGGLSAKVIASQIAGRKKAKDKLPLWHQTRGIIYPPPLNLEQCSSQATASFKAKILKEECQSFGAGADITGGFGVDSFFLSQIFAHFHYVEQNAHLADIVKNNHMLLNPTNSITHTISSAEEFIDTTSDKVDLIYLDPSRRNELDKKVFKLADCSPDIIQMQSSLFNISDRILLKASPLLDIPLGISEIRNVKKVWVVAVQNECKEILFLSQKDFAGEPIVEAVNLSSEGYVLESFAFSLRDEKEAVSEFAEPRAYLYEPNAAIMKSGAFKLTGQRFGISKLQANTHLYTSDDLLSDFPGRVFKMSELNPGSREATRLYPLGKANVLVRNYPLSAEELKKKWKLKDGGDLYLIGFSGQQRKYVAAATRIK